jgi:hypothetical protein
MLYLPGCSPDALQKNAGNGWDTIFAWRIGKGFAAKANSSRGKRRPVMQLEPKKVVLSPATIPQVLGLAPITG